MTLQEIAEASVVDVNDQSFTVEERFADPFDILEFCSTLVSFRNADEDEERFWNDDWQQSSYIRRMRRMKRVHFAHFSVQQYLLSSAAQDSANPSFFTRDSLGHSHITQACLIYLLDFNQGRRYIHKDLHQFPFLGYAAVNWTIHLNKAESTDRDIIEELIKRLFDPENDIHLINFLNICDPSRGRYKLNYDESTKRNKDDFEPALYYAAHCGLATVVNFLLQRLDANSRGDHISAAIRGAVTGRHDELVETLLSERPNYASPFYGEALSEAVNAQNLVWVKKLLQARASAGGPLQCEPRQTSILHRACNSGFPEGIRLLIDHGYDMHAEHRIFGTPLGAALRHCRSDDSENLNAVKVLVEKIGRAHV